MYMWKFSELEYKRFDVDEITKKIDEAIEAIKNAKSGEEVLDIMMKNEETSNEMVTQFQIVTIRHTLDTGDKFYEDENNWLNEVYPTMMPKMLQLNAAIEESPYRSYVEEKLGKQYFVEMELQKKTFCEANIPLMQAEAKLTDEYQSIMAQCQVEFMGERRNLYGLQKFFEDDDREVRRAAFKAYSNFYHDNEKRLEEIWDELIKIRNEMGRNLGYENYVPVGYMNQGRTDYGRDEVASFREQVRTVLVPFCEKLYKAQAERLGYDKLYVFDEKKVFPDGNAHPIGDDDFMISEAQKMYHELSPETAEFIDFMIDHELMDLKNKPGKASTGYMTLLPSLKAPFVFSCFNGTIFDMQVLTHELGHAFAGYRACRKQPVQDYFFASTDIAEIHSMSMEQFTYGYAERFFGDDADKYRFAHLQEALTFVPFGVAVDEFQHICYEHPELTPKERTYEWHKLEEKYMPWRTYDNDEFMERGGYWYHKLHIYLYPFYYINYTLTTMGAMEFKKKYAEDPEKAWKDYLALTDVGGSRSYLEILKCANLSVPFEEGAVERATGYAMDILEKEMAQL
ncbi:MAG: M3 family oligoendopeptidase [Clostridiales bacterium]|nr:M3 family oligoendopeptidase [Clostridiales bacterium]